MNRQIVYTAGPITTKSENRKWDFYMAARSMAQQIWAAGHVAICPQMNTMMMDDPCIEDGTFYGGDELIITRCVDAMVLLPGWELSHGACNERDLAFTLELPVFYHDCIDRMWDWLSEKREEV